MASHALSRNLFSLTSPTSATTICSSAYSRSLPYSSRSIGNLQRPYRPRTFATSTPFNADFTHTIIGAGAVGLAVARQLAAREGTSTLLIERHGTVGTETSSRNSEVIHAGLYYGPDSLKTKLCIEGKQMLYDLCSKKSIPHRNTSKWIVAQTDQQLHECEKVRNFAQTIGVPTRWLSREEAARREPDVKADAGILESSSTGIVDSHSLMAFMEGDIQERGGVLAVHSPVTRIEAIDNGRGGYRVWTKASNDPDAVEESITTEVLINSGGLGACTISNMLLPESRHRKQYYAKGTYFSYASSHPKPKTLIYPAPTPGLGGLGTHLTVDISGRVRFGPDVEWVDDPTDLRPSPDRLSEAIEAITAYLPSIDKSAIDLDYCGIRPKLGRLSAVGEGKTFQDFYIKKEEGFEGFVNLLGIESPGLTSCLAIGKLVDEMLYK